MVANGKTLSPQTVTAMTSVISLHSEYTNIKINIMQITESKGM